MAAPDTQTKVGWHLPFLDLLLLLVLILLALVNPPDPSGEEKPPGTISVEIRWPDDQHCDVDLWVRAPKDKPVGYSRLRGTVFNLLRDDVGGSMDLSGLNYENAYTRGTPDGEYVVNIHLYSAAGCTLPVKVFYSVVHHNEKIKRTIDRSVADLERQGQELTLVRFVFSGGAFQSDSIHRVPMGLR